MVENGAHVIELNASLEVVVDLGAELGEGPVWDDRTGHLLFVDSTIGRVYRFDPAGGVLTHVDAGGIIGVAIPRTNGGLVVSGVGGLFAIGANGHSSLLVPVETDKPDHRMNDAKCDSRGRLLSGTLSGAYQRGACALFRIDPDRTLHRLVDGVTISNGMGWSPDETMFYYVDTTAGCIDRFDYDIDTGEITNRRRFVDIDKADGRPDGLCVDRQGHVWVALYRGGAVRRYAPDGRCVSQITLPVSGVTSCNFGGDTLSDLYITTAQLGVPAETLAAQPRAGGLYRCRPGVSGLPSHCFAG